MKFPTSRILFIASCALLLAGVPARAEEVVAVSSKTAKDYVRKKLPDGSVQPETYAFGKGDNLSGARVDPTADHLDFLTVARTIAVPLAEKRYYPTQDPTTTNELIMVYWGTTLAPEFATQTNTHILMQLANQHKEVADKMKRAASAPGASRAAKMYALAYAASVDDELLAATIGVQAENQEREDRDMKTATLLGYDSWWMAVNGAMDGSVFGRRKGDMRAELEEDRYFVVLTAFDYPKLVKEKKSKFLWEVRFSIREHGTAFDSRLAGMAKLASDYFGRDSGGLQHDPLPRANVEIGPIRSLGVLSDR